VPSWDPRQKGVDHTVARKRIVLTDSATTRVVDAIHWPTSRCDLCEDMPLMPFGKLLLSMD